MAAITTMVAAAAVGVGAASAISQRNAQKRAEAQAREQARRQETRAREAAALRGRDPQEARVKIGADGETIAAQATGSNEKGAVTSRNTTTGVNRKRLFGMGGTSASRIGGL
jgi:uncharacterized protein HemX